MINNVALRLRSGTTAVFARSEATKQSRGNTLGSPRLVFDLARNDSKRLTGSPRRSFHSLLAMTKKFVYS